MFTLTNSLKDAIGLVNSLEVKKLGKVLQRIIRGLDQKDRIFDDDELAQLQEVLGLSPANLNTVINACSYFFEESAYRGGLKGEALTEVGVVEDKVEVFVALWENEGPTLVSKLKENTLGGPKVLKAVDWRMNVKTSQSNLQQLSHPNAVMEFTLDYPDVSGSGEEKFLVGFTNEQLGEFFEKLDKVHEQLESLT